MKSTTSREKDVADIPDPYRVSDGRIEIDAEVGQIKTEYSGLVEIEAKEADYQARRDAEYVREVRESVSLSIANIRREPITITFKVRMADAKGFGIGSRLRLTVERIESA